MNRPVKRALAMSLALVAVVAAAHDRSRVLAAPAEQIQNGPIAFARFPGCNHSYSGELDIAVAGGGVRRLHSLCSGEPIDDPTFTLNGRRIAYVQQTISFSAIKITNRQGRDTRFADHSELYESNPAFLANGRLVFVGETVKHPAGIDREKSGTWSVRPNGSGLHHLFLADEDAVSRDGHEFLALKRGNLLLLNASGHRIRQLTTSGNVFDPTFSPDGRSVAFDQGRDSTDLYIEQIDGSRLRRLTTDGLSGEPTFSPDGQWLAFTRSTVPSSEDSNIVALSLADPQHQVNITDFAHIHVFSPAWAPVPAH